MRTNFYHPNPAHLREIYERGIAKTESRDFKTLREVISFPALLEFAGMPRLRNQQCFAHKGSTGSSLSFYQHEKSGQWMFCCNNPQCALKGDVVDFWFELLKQAGLYRADWSRRRAAGDLIERVNSGEIDPSIREFEDEPASKPHGSPRGDGEDYFRRLQDLIKKRKGQGISGSQKLPKPVKLNVKQAILGLFPENRLIMLADRRDGRHHIMRRDVWLSGRYHAKPTLEYCGFVSQNYCSGANVDGTSYEAFAGIKRRWLVIEGDTGTLEQQWWIHRQLQPSCLCYSGGKSLHGWYDVSGWTTEECFELYAKAI